MDYPGKVITKTQVTPTQTSASGNWTLDDQAAAIKNNNWPVALVPNPISKSLRFNSADSAYLNRTFNTPTDNKKWTWSCWLKRSGFGGSGQYLIMTFPDGSNYAYINLTSSQTLELGGQTGGVNFSRVTSAVFRDASAWYAINVVVDTTLATANDRIKIYVNNVLQTLTGTAPNQNVNLVINTAAVHRIGAHTSSANYYLDGYLTEINFIDGQALDPSNFGLTNPQTGQWIPKKYTGTYGTNGFYLNFKDATSTTTLGYDYSGNANNWTTNNFSVGSVSSKVLEIVNATKSGSVTLSATVVGSGTVNLTAFGGCGNISGSVFTGISSLNGLISDWQTHTVYKNGSSLFTVQGGAVNNDSGTQTATQSRTAQTVTQTGISVVSGDVISIAFGANNAVTSYYGYPNGAPSLTITASSGVFIADGSNNDSLTDVPTPWVAYNTTGDVGGVVRGNYATWNPLNKNLVNYTYTTYANGNLEATATNNDALAAGTINFPSSGKFYFEVVWTAAPSASTHYIATNNGTTTAQYRMNGQIYNGGSLVGTYATLAVNDVIGVAVDCGAGSVAFYKNGALQTTVTSTAAADSYIYAYLATTNSVLILNCGQRPFAYTPPAGFRSLCTTNLPATTIGFGLTNQGDDYFNTVLYTGNGGTQTVSGVGFQPDLTWVKVRSAANSNWLNDAVRGAGLSLSSNTNEEEKSYAAYFTAFNSDGFALAGGTGGFNANGDSYVGWNWNAGGSNVTNTSGSITSTVRANTTAGFSVVTWAASGTNPTIGHGLGAAPSMIIAKSRNNAGYGWAVYHVSLGRSNFLSLDSTAAQTSYTNYWGTANPTSTVFGTSDGPYNNNFGNMVAYCFAAVPGYSAFGSYTGNGSADGPFIYTGFRPRWVLIKETGNANSWELLDTARNPYNAADKRLFPNDSLAEATTSNTLDIISNGFKPRVSNTGVNRSGGTYIYAAFAESPFQFSNAR